MARLNFSHVPLGSYDEPAAKLALVRSAPGVHSTLDAGVAEKRPPNLRVRLCEIFSYILNVGRDVGHEGSRDPHEAIGGGHYGDRRGF